VKVLAVLALAVLVSPALADEPRPEVTAALEQIKAEKTINLSTTGRKSGKLHTRPIWFVVDGATIVVQAGKDGKTDWYKNLQKNPKVQLRQGAYHFIATATPVTDAAEADRIHKLFTDKYTMAWIGSFVGSSFGSGRPVVLKPEGVSTRE